MRDTGWPATVPRVRPRVTLDYCAGLWLALALALVFLAVTAVQSAATSVVPESAAAS